MEENKKITFEDIQKANKQIKTMKIERTDKKTGKTVTKEYAEVAQRLKAYRTVYPAGTIITEMVSNENGICVFRAKVFDEESNLLATGTASENQKASFINQTSYIENCETSAVGRALGIAGFGIDTSISSAEEVQIAIASENENESNKNIGDEKLQLLVKFSKLVNDKKVDYEKLLEYYHVKTNSEMSAEQLKEAIGELEKREDK